MKFGQSLVAAILPFTLFLSSCSKKIDPDTALIRNNASDSENIGTGGFNSGGDDDFSLADGLIAAAEAGATAAIQPGGSVRDDEVIEAANERNMAMIFTRTRHFKH